MSLPSTPASSPAWGALKARLAALKGELVKVLTERDAFLEDELPNLEAIWLREVGSLELELLGLEVEARGARRFLELLRAQASRGERLDVAGAVAQVEVELSAWRREVETKAKDAAVPGRSGARRSFVYCIKQYTIARLAQERVRSATALVPGVRPGGIARPPSGRQG